MKATPWAVFAAFALALCAFAPVTASAQSRDAIYTVGGVRVDETAANASAAQQAGFAAAQRAAFERLVRRVTVPAELSARGTPDVQGLDLERLVLSTDVNDERRSGTRYIGRLTVRFDPNGVRALLRANNLTVLDTRTGPTLVVPATGPEIGPETAAAWRAAWSEGGFDQELAPIAVAPQGLSGAPDWAAAAPFAQAAGAGAVLYATLRVQGSTASAALVQVGANNARRDFGEVTAGLAGADIASIRAGLASLADQASQRVQSDWKARIAGSSGQSARVSASALYSSEQQWEQIKSGLEGAAATVISQIRIEAVGREGALVSFSFTGDRAALAAELARRGVTLADSANGPTLRVAQR